MAKRFDYLNPECSATLVEGLEEYTAAYPFLNDNSGKTPASSWFRKHDLTHIVFGTRPFEIRGETINDIWTIFGSDVTLCGYLKFFKLTDVSYNMVIDSYISRHGSRSRVYWKMATQLPIACLAIGRAVKMTKKWPWHKPEPFLHQPLNQIRSEFGIQLVEP